MKVKIIKESIFSKLFLCLTIICLLFTKIISFKFFKAFNLLSNDYLVLITNEGIIKYDPATQNQILLVESSDNIIIETKDEKLISFAQFPSDEGGYVFCRLNKKIYIFDKDLNTYYQYFEVSSIENVYCILKPYKKANGDITLIISYVNSDNIIKILNYKINIGQTNNLATPLDEIIKEVITPNGLSSTVMNKVIACELITVSESPNNLLVCFTVSQSNYICALIFNPENLTFLNYSTSFKETGAVNYIQSDLSHDNKNSLICLMTSMGYLSCLLYNNNNNTFSNINKFISDCYTDNMGVKCIHEKKECSLYFSDVNNVHFLKFDKNFIVKDTNIDNKKCYASTGIMDSNCNSIFSSHISYFKNEGKYFLFKTCLGNNDFSIFEITQTCNKNSESSCIDCENRIIIDDDNESSIPNLKSTILTTIPTTIVTSFPTQIPTSFPTTIPIQIPTPFSKTIPTQIPTTILTLNPTTEITTLFTKIMTTITTKNTGVTMLTTISTIHTPKSTIPTVLSSTNIAVKSGSTSLFLSSTSPLIQSTNLMLSSYLNIDSSFLEKDISSIIQFYGNEDLIKGKININKEELEKNLDDIMNVITIGKKYAINGRDYDMKITPINCFIIII